MFASSRFVLRAARPAALDAAPARRWACYAYPVVKICARCHEISPGGFRCEACGGPLLHTSDAGAKDLPEAVWRNQRVDYGARRGMIFRFMAIFAGAAVALYGVRAAVPQPPPWNWIGAITALAAGLALWWGL